MVLTLWTCQLSSLYERLSGRSIRPEVNENRPGGAFSWAAAGECLLALTRQPLRQPGQPRAAAPDSCIRVASAPGERSYIYGKPMPETGQLYFPGHSAVPVPVPGRHRLGVGARIPAGAGSRCGGARCGAALGAAGLGAAGLGVAAGLLGGVRDAGDAEVLSRGACCAHPRRPDAVKPPLRDLAWSSGAAERGVGACNGPLRMFYVGWLRRVWLGATVGGSAAGAAGAP